MAEYVRMPKAHYEAACESIRAKTGKADLIKSGDMSAEIDSIVAGGVSETVILAEQNYTSTLDSTYGYFNTAYPTAAFAIGQTYRIVMDGKEYSCVGKDGSAFSSGSVVFGNLTNFGGSGNGEPFAAQYNPEYNVVSIMYLKDTAPTEHTVAIYGISDSGGSSADVRYVTFMSHNGAVEYGKKAVAVGDDCADPIARGVFSTPTRESTVQYEYSFYGWATEVDGAANANWGKSVTEDRTVYANFAAAVRYYTISFYDGDTLLTTKSVAYGSVPSYTPKKDGYDFDGWTPTPVAVTGEASYTAKWKVKAAFATATWAEIIEIAQSGNAASTFALGDERTETITYDDGTSEEITWRIVALDNAFNCVDGGKDNITIGAKHALSKKRQLHSTMSTAYANSNLATYLNNDFYSALPEDLKGGIRDAYIDGENNNAHKVWIAMPYELGIGVIYNNSPLEYYDTNSKRIATLGANGEATEYWTRTANHTGSYSYYKVIGTDGATLNNNYIMPNTTYAVVPFFCI